jgi:hypothetical protein
MTTSKVEHHEGGGYETSASAVMKDNSMEEFLEKKKANAKPIQQTNFKSNLS